MSQGSPLRLWSLRIHRHCGLILGPFLLIFATSTLIFNHLVQSESQLEPEQWTLEDAEIPDLEGLPLARAVVAQTGLEGEIDWVSKQPATGNILVLLSRPGERTEIRVDMKAESLRVETRYLSPLDRILYLHKRPGPHVASIRGNWWFLGAWRTVADTSAVGMLILSLSGVYLWWRMPSERKPGMVFLTAGVLLLNGLFFFMLR